MTPKEKLIAIAITFGLVTEGLTMPQLQEALDANTGYQEYQKANTAATAATEAKDKAEALAVDLQEHLNDANSTIKQLEGEVDTANAKLEVFAQANAEAESEKIYYTSKAGDKYQVTQDAFRFQGNVYKAAEAVVDNTEVLETLIAAKSFILKKA